MVNSTPGREITIQVYKYPLESQTGRKPDQLASIFSGSHDPDCLWQRASTVVGEFTGDATCTFSVRESQNITVVSDTDGTGNQPGVSITAPDDIIYKVCAIAAIVGSSNTVMNARLTDGTDIYFAQARRWQPNDGSPQSNVPICGLVSLKKGVTKTVFIEVRSDSGTITMSGQTGGSNFGNAIEWTITPETQASPAPHIVNSVVSSSTGVIGIESARIEQNGTHSVEVENGDWIDSLVDNGTGDTTINVKTGIFSGEPVCTCNGYDTSDRCVIDPTTPISSSAIRVQMIQNTDSAIDATFMIICHGPR